MVVAGNERSQNEDMQNRVRNREIIDAEQASLEAQMVKNLSAMQETCIPSLGWEYFLEKEMATHSSILAWESPWAEEPGGLQVLGSQRVGHDWVTKLSLLLMLRAGEEHGSTGVPKKD